MGDGSQNVTNYADLYKINDNTTKVYPTERLGVNHSYVFDPSTPLIVCPVNTYQLNDRKNSTTPRCYRNPYVSRDLFIIPQFISNYNNDTKITV